MKIIDPQGRNALDSEYPVIERTGRILFSPLPKVATAITLVSGTAYFVYVGRTSHQITVNYIEFYVNSYGQGNQFAEIGVFSSPSAPNKSDQTISRLYAVNGLDSLTTNGLKRNSNALNYIVAAGTYLWAGIRTAMGTSQPTLAGLCMDYYQGMVLSMASSGDLTAIASWPATRITLPGYLNTAIAPDLRITLD